MIRKSWVCGGLLLGSLWPASLHAAPRNASWVQDVRLQAPNTSETAVFYRHPSPDAFKADEEGYDALTLRLHTGLHEGVEATPLFTVEQRGEEPLRLQEVGLETRVGVWGKAANPSVLAYGRYLKGLGQQWAHQMVAGGVGRREYGHWFFLGEARLAFAQGGELSSAWEAWVGASAGYAFYQPWQLTAGLELFSIQPLGGERLSDPTFGLSAETATYYYAPSFSAQIGPLWTTFSAASGYMLSEAASQLLLHWAVGVSH